MHLSSWSMLRHCFSLNVMAATTWLLLALAPVRATWTVVGWLVCNIFFCFLGFKLKHPEFHMNFKWNRLSVRLLQPIFPNLLVRFRWILAHICTNFCVLLDPVRLYRLTWTHGVKFEYGNKFENKKFYNICVISNDRAYCNEPISILLRISPKSNNFKESSIFNSVHTALYS